MNNFAMISYEYEKNIDQTILKKNGIVYTPQWLAQHIVSNAFNQWKKFYQTKGTPNFIADTSCGTGVFLHEILLQSKRLGWNPNILGQDIDEKAINICKKTLPSKKNIHLSIKDSLLEDINEYNKYDIIVGNPPYVSSSQLSPTYKTQLKNKYKCATTNTFDLSIIFLEDILNRLNKGGIASIILSNKFMTSNYGKKICELLALDYKIISIEDFHDIQVFEGFTTYTCIITLINDKPAKKFLYTRFHDKIDHRSPKLPRHITESILSERLTQHPWNFLSNLGDEIMRICSNTSHPFMEDIFPNIHQGIRTGANDVFVIDRADANFIESDLLKPFINGTHIKNSKILESDSYIIFPYIRINNKLEPISENVLSLKYPLCYKYLVERKNVLSQRSLQNNTKWYEYSRRQSLEVIFKRKILIKEMMPEAVFSADLKGELVFASGYALDVEKLADYQIKGWISILSTPIMEFLSRNHGTQLHSGWFRLMKQHLKAIRLPNITQDQLKKISNLTERMEVNQIVAQSFGLSEDHVLYINNYLVNVHAKSLPKTDRKQIENTTDKYEPVRLTNYNKYHINREDLQQAVTYSLAKKQPIHNWYKYTQAFSPLLVNKILDELGATNDSIILDPFNGCGTTTTTCAYRGMKSLGIEISPLMAYIARIKASKWNIDKLHQAIKEFSQLFEYSNNKRKIIFSEYFEKAYSTQIFQQLASIANTIDLVNDEEIKNFYTIGLLSIMEEVSRIRKHGSHYRFLNNSNSIGLQKLNIDLINDNENILTIYINQLTKIYTDICSTGGNPNGSVTIFNKSCLLIDFLEHGRVDFIITSPPYLNRNNYISQQKAELDILQMLSTKDKYKELVKSTFRSHTDSHLSAISTSTIPEVEKIISHLNLEKGNNPKIPHMISGYFEDIKKMLEESYKVLRKNGKAAFVVGNTRWGGVVIPVDHILAKLAEEIGFSVERILVTRLKGNSPQQMKKFGKISVRESIVVLSK